MALRNLGKARRRRMMSDINVVPYIDVMLVLVVILMVAAPFVNPSVVNLPSVQKASNNWHAFRSRSGFGFFGFDTRCDFRR